MSENIFYELTPVQVLNGYVNGIFPMGNDDDSITWYEANPRAILPLNKPLSVNRSLKQILNKNVFEIKLNKKFTEVMEECAARETTWINELIIDAYTQLHRMGYAHSVEAYSEGKLAGGLYGVAINGVFFGESMFFKKSYASKVSVVKLYDILTKNNFRLLDIQMMTDVFKSFGAEHITKNKYLKELEKALQIKCEFKL
ncbi:MAG: leucyl/phenylalanyl-tRNA--protein transferase [Bacteroidetes bacterium]|nr:leucyl/phenylalanyl-tRNA--protein transferase [Bacteroidota bacterium]